MSNNHDDLSDEMIATYKAVGHMAGAVGVMFFGLGLFFLLITLSRIANFNFSSIGLDLVFAAIPLAIGGGLLHVAKKILDDVK